MLGEVDWIDIIYDEVLLQSLDFELTFLYFSTMQGSRFALGQIEPIQRAATHRVYCRDTGYHYPCHTRSPAAGTFLIFGLLASHGQRGLCVGMDIKYKWMPSGCVVEPGSSRDIQTAR